MAGSAPEAERSTPTKKPEEQRWTFIRTPGVVWTKAALPAPEVRNDRDSLLVAAGEFFIRFGKKYAFIDGTWKTIASPPKTARVNFHQVVCRSFEELQAVLETLSTSLRNCHLLRVGLHPGHADGATGDRRWHASCGGKPGEDGPLIDVPLTWLVFDVDKIPVPAGCGYQDPERLIEAVLGVLPEPFRRRSCCYQLSSSAGIREPDKVKAHLFFRATEPVGCRAFHKCLQQLPAAVVDHQIGVGTQPIFTAAPGLVGGVDPLEGRRIGVHRGDCDEVDMSGLLAKVSERKVRTTAARLAAPGRVTLLQKRATATRRVGVSQASEAAGFELLKDWKRIAERSMGNDREGYNQPIFLLIVSAVRRGLSLGDVQLMLPPFVWKTAKTRGDLPARHDDLQRYLAPAEIERAFNNVRV